MTTRFEIGDHVSWNSEAGRCRGPSSLSTPRISTTRVMCITLRKTILNTKSRATRPIISRPTKAARLNVHPSKGTVWSPHFDWPFQPKLDGVRDRNEPTAQYGSSPYSPLEESEFEPVVPRCALIANSAALVAPPGAARRGFPCRHPRSDQCHALRRRCAESAG